MQHVVWDIHHHAEIDMDFLVIERESRRGLVGGLVWGLVVRFRAGVGLDVRRRVDRLVHVLKGVVLGRRGGFVMENLLLDPPSTLGLVCWSHDVHWSSAR